MESKNLWKLIVDFLRGLYREDGGVSSKRFTGVELLQVIVVMVLCEQLFGLKMNMEALIILVTAMLTCFGMNLAAQIKAMGVKKGVASDIIKSDDPGANQDAKDVLQADRP